MRSKILVIFITLAAIWGASFLFMRIASPAFGAITLAFVRVLMAAIALLAVSLFLHKPFLSGKQRVWAMVIGVLNSAIPFVLFGYATQHLPAGYTAVLNATVPFWGLGIGVFMFKETLSVYKIVALVCALVGLAMMLGLGTVELNASTLNAAAACLLATLLYAIVGNVTKRKLLGADPVAQSLAAMVSSSLVLLPFALWQWPAVNPSAGDWAAALALGLLCSAVAYTLYFWLIANAGLMYGLNVTLLIPVFGVLWGILFLGETLTFLSAVGAVVTIVSTAVVLGVLPLKKA